MFDLARAGAREPTIFVCAVVNPTGKVDGYDVTINIEEATGLKIGWDDAELEPEPGRLFPDDQR